MAYWLNSSDTMQLWVKSMVSPDAHEEPWCRSERVQELLDAYQGIQAATGAPGDGEDGMLCTTVA